MSNIHELRRRSDVSRWHSLTHSILINLFIKAVLNNFLLPPLVTILLLAKGVQSSSGRLQEGSLTRGD